MKKLMTIMGLAAASAVMLIPTPSGTAASTAAQRASTMHVATAAADPAPAPVIDEPAVATPAPAAPAPARPAAAVKAPAIPPVPKVTVPDLTGANLPGRLQNDALVPGHWTQATNGAIYRDADPNTAPTVGATDPAYEAGLNAQLCAARPQICQP